MSRPMRALVVDDDEQVRYAVRGLLEHLGVEVDEAGDGVEALGKVGTGDYQVVVTDIHMPRMDGLELLAKIQAGAAPRPKVIVVTAHGTERQAVQAIKGGAFDYFKKPFEVEEILAVLRRAIESIELTAKVEQLEGELTLAKKLVFGSAAMKQLAVLVQRVAPRDVTVLLT
ncbi:MAG: response regulator, partial [Kofleriaceae bacterium]